MMSLLINCLPRSIRYRCTLKSLAMNKTLIVLMWALVACALVSTSVLWKSMDSKYGVEQDGGGYRLSDWLNRLRRSIDLAYDPNQRVSIRSQDIRYGETDEICEENDFAGSDGNVTLYMNWTELYHAEEEILRTSTSFVRKHLHTDNVLVRSIYADAAHGGRRPERKQPHRTVSDALSEGILIDDYYYVSGGHWIPAKCHPRWKVAIIVPFRDRFYQLPIFLRNIVPFLKRQKLEFGIYVIEQANGLDFNRAMLMNVGFQQALNFSRWDCFIFHDVDHLPLNNANYYGCSHMPRHFISGADRWNYKLQYSFFFGAVTGFTRSQIQKFNGFPNAYWGWGGEDDDILIRIQAHGFFKTRPWGVTGFYNVIAEHHKSAPKNKKRVCLLDYAHERLESDGLSNLVYPPARVTLTPLYTNISVNITKLALNPTWTVCTRDYKRAKKDELVNWKMN
ncbi:beta-1,4-galactosyltransferase 6-like isoform X2 [Acanthaster planci]|uniref:Beta-1,4-galactosyltransferase n=1 Tax=Acanthaster planci TaxID=133434 RepID=A0A8B7YM11_ACAPL|nr:beta-1,4-galactosyltransferase 6-like isoform X2 [Acanthaster planci]